MQASNYKKGVWVHGYCRHLFAVWQRGQEVDERRGVLVERPDRAGVDAAAGCPSKVDAGDAVAGAPEQGQEPEPAPGAVAGTVH